MLDIIVSVALLLCVSVVCAVLLTLSDKFFGIKEDTTVTAIRESLPGANCGACGFSGCDGYAKALADKSCEKTNLCVPGGDGVAKEIAATLGVEAEDVVEKVAFVACNGSCDVVQMKFDYQGQMSCHAASSIYGGDKLCKYACLGYGDCAAVCPHDAISIENGVAKVDPRKCAGCGLCKGQCPHSIIHVVNDTARVVVKCSNQDKGAQVRKYCANGCIGCMKCQKTCAHGAIKVVNNLAVIDYSLCVGCGECVKACPIHCLKEENLVCGAHLN